MIKNNPSIIIGGEATELVPNTLKYSRENTYNCDTCRYWDALKNCKGDDGKLDFEKFPCPQNNNFKYAYAIPKKGGGYNLVLTSSKGKLVDCEKWERAK